MNEILNFLTKKRVGPVRLFLDNFPPFPFPVPADDSGESNKIQNLFIDAPQLLQSRLNLLNNSYKKGDDVKEQLKCLEEKLIELKKAIPEIRDEIESILLDTRKSLTEKYGDGSKD